VPHRIDAALIGFTAAHPGPVKAVEQVASGKLAFSRYPSASAALRAIDQQDVYAALDLNSSRPILYVASAAGVSVARVLDRMTIVDPAMRLVDTHPLSEHDPNGVEIYYLLLIATVIGFFTIFQAGVNAPLSLVLYRVVFVLVFSTATSLVLTLIDGPWLGRIDLPVAETWGILALAVLAAASFAEVSSYGLGRWAVLPTFLFFAILASASSGGAVAPPLLPQPFAFFSQWLPTGATVTALRDAVYFRGYQHARPVLVLAAWALALFAAWLVVMRQKARTSAPAPSQAAAPSAPLRSPADLQGEQDLVRRDRQIADADAGRVVNPVGDGGRGAGDPHLAETLGAHRVDLRIVLVDPGSLHAADVGVGGDVVADEVVVDVVAEVRVQDAVLVQCHREPPCHPAQQLRPGGLGVDDPSDGEDAQQPRHVYLAGVGVHADFGELRAEGVHRVALRFRTPSIKVSCMELKMLSGLPFTAHGTSL
jgi:hypothetical protein